MAGGRSGRDRRLAAYRNLTCLVRPDARVTGASPLSDNKVGAEENRSRASPISEISTPAVTGPIPGKLVKIGVSGCAARSSRSR